MGLCERCRVFMGCDAQKFRHIWLMNEEECKSLARSILDADRIIQQQQLGLPWTPPPQLYVSYHTPPLAPLLPSGGSVRVAVQVILDASQYI